MFRTFVFALGLSLLAGCASSGPHFKADGLRHSEYGYVLKYSQRAQRVFVSGDWRIENFQTDGSGEPIKLKSGPRYETAIAFDYDGDGEPDNIGTFPSYDLRLKHRKTAAHLWLSNQPISADHGQTDLSVLMRDLVDGVGGTGQFQVQVGGPNHHKTVVVVENRRYAAKLVSTTPRTVSGFPALEGLIEIYNLDQSKLDEQRPIERARVIMLRPPFRHAVVTQSARQRSRRGSAVPEVPVLTILAYSAQVDQFDVAAADLDVLAGQLKFIQLDP